MTIGRMQSPTPNKPNHEWYEKQNHVRLPSIGEAKAWIDDAYTGISPPVPAAPVLTKATVTYTGGGYVGNTFIATPSANGYPNPTYTYQWFLDDVPTVTTRTYVPPSEGDVKVEITATNSEGTDSLMSAVYSVVIQPVAPTVDVVVTPTSGAVGDLFTVSITSDGYPPPTDAIQWRLNGVDIPGATGATYTAAATGSLTCRVVSTNTGGSANDTSAPITITPAPAAPVITNIATSPSGGAAGVTVRVTSVTASGYPAPTITYQWRLDSADIPGATASSFVTTGPGTYTCAVTATNASGSSLVESVGIVITPAPVAAAIGSLVIDPLTGDVGQVLTATPTVTGYPTPTVTYQWKLDNVNIAGQTNAAITTASPGSYSVVVTATNSAGSDSLTSSSVTINPTPVAPVVNGVTLTPPSGQVGAAFTATVDMIGYPTPTVEYTWKIDGGTVHTGSSNVYNPAAPGELTVDVVATNSEGSDSDTSLPVSVTPTPVSPSIASVGITPTSGVVGDLLTANVSASGYPTPTLTYQWRVGLTNIPGATASTYTPLSEGDYSVAVQATNSEGSDTATSAQVTIDPAPLAPTIGDVTVTPASSPAGSTFTASASGVTGYPTPTLSYQWKLDDVNIGGATNPTYAAPDPGSLTCEVVATNLSGTDTVESDPVLVTLLPEVTNASVTPAIGVVGTEFTVAQTSIGNPTPTVTYQWKLDGADIPSANAAAYTSVSEGQLTCVVTATNSEGDDSLESNFVTVSLAPADASVDSVSISPSGGETGNVYTANVTVSGNPAPAVSYQWLMDDVDMVGETGNTVTPATTGSLTVRVTATNSGATDEAVSTPVTITPAQTVPVITDPLIHPTVVEVGETITAVPIYTGYPAPTLSYQWYLDDVLQGGETNITYTPGSAGTVKCTMTATNANGSDVETSMDALVYTPQPWDYVWDIEDNGESGEPTAELMNTGTSNSDSVSFGGFSPAEGDVVVSFCRRTGSTTPPGKPNNVGPTIHEGGSSNGNYGIRVDLTVVGPGGMSGINSSANTSRSMYAIYRGVDLARLNGDFAYTYHNSSSALPWDGIADLDPQSIVVIFAQVASGSSRLTMRSDCREIEQQFPSTAEQMMGDNGVGAVFPSLTTWPTESRSGDPSQMFSGALELYGGPSAVEYGYVAGDYGGLSISSIGTIDIYALTVNSSNECKLTTVDAQKIPLVDVITLEIEGFNAGAAFDMVWDGFTYKSAAQAGLKDFADAENGNSVGINMYPIYTGMQGIFSAMGAAYDPSDGSSMNTDTIDSAITAIDPVYFNPVNASLSDQDMGLTGSGGTAPVLREFQLRQCLEFDGIDNYLVGVHNGIDVDYFEYMSIGMTFWLEPGMTGDMIWFANTAFADLDHVSAPFDCYDDEMLPYMKINNGSGRVYSNGTTVGGTSIPLEGEPRWATILLELDTGGWAADAGRLRATLDGEVIYDKAITCDHGGGAHDIFNRVFVGRDSRGATPDARAVDTHLRRWFWVMKELANEERDLALSWLASDPELTNPVTQPYVLLAPDWTIVRHDNGDGTLSPAIKFTSGKGPAPTGQVRWTTQTNYPDLTDTSGWAPTTYDPTTQTWVFDKRPDAPVGWEYHLLDEGEAYTTIAARWRLVDGEGEYSPASATTKFFTMPTQLDVGDWNADSVYSGTPGEHLILVSLAGFTPPEGKQDVNIRINGTVVDDATDQGDSTWIGTTPFSPGAAVTVEARYLQLNGNTQQWSPWSDNSVMVTIPADPDTSTPAATPTAPDWEFDDDLVDLGDGYFTGRILFNGGFGPTSGGQVNWSTSADANSTESSGWLPCEWDGTGWVLGYRDWTTPPQAQYQRKLAGESLSGVYIRWRVLESAPGTTEEGYSLRSVDTKGFTVPGEVIVPGDIPPMASTPLQNAINKNPIPQYSLSNTNTSNDGWGAGSTVALACAAFAGQTNAYPRLLEHIRRVIADNANRDPCCEGGYGAQHEAETHAGIAISRHVPDVWNQLNTDEKERCDLVMIGCLVGNGWASSDWTHNSTNPFGGSYGVLNDLRGSGQVHRGWNANHRMPKPAGVMFALAYFGLSTLTSMMSSFTLSTFVSNLNSKNLKNMYNRFNSPNNSPRSGWTAKQSLEQSIRNWAFGGDTIADYMDIVDVLANSGFNKNIQLRWTNDGDNPDCGKPIGNYSGYPGAATGQYGAAQELGLGDARRSSIEYSIASVRIVGYMVCALTAAGLYNPAAMVSRTQQCNVGVQDINQRIQRGWRDFRGNGLSPECNLTWPAAATGHKWDVPHGGYQFEWWNDVVMGIHGL